jgi:hypothetical protein
LSTRDQQGVTTSATAVWGAICTQVDNEEHTVFALTVDIKATGMTHRGDALGGGRRGRQICGARRYMDDEFRTRLEAIRGD